jgi:hypothetical protein
MMNIDYIVLGSLFGFAVETGRRRRTVVELVPWRFRIFRKGTAPLERGLYDTGALTELACYVLPRRRQEFERVFVLIKAECERIVSSVPNEVKLLQKRIVEETGVATGPHMSDAFYARRFLVSDVLRFRAAAVAVGFCDKLVHGARSEAAASEALLDRLEDWMGLFSPDGRGYKSLRRTLMNLAAEVPSAALLALPSLVLPRFVTDPVELSAICALGAVRRTFASDEIWRNRLEIVTGATSREIAAATVRYAEETERRFEGQLFYEQRPLMHYLDFPELHTGRLNGLLEKAMRWHYDVANGTIEETLSWANLPHEFNRLDAVLPPPPFGMPVDPRVRLLDTVGAVLEEGRSMRHCVGSLIGKAVRGRSFFFHVDYKSKRATIELDSHGSLVQASGPCNSDNPAVLWGARQLEECARIGRERRFRCKADAIRASDPFDRLRRRLGRFEWFDIAERLHGRPPTAVK